MLNSKRDFEQNLVDCVKLKGDFCNALHIKFPENIGTEYKITYNKFGRVCLIRIRTQNHQTSHCKLRPTFYICAKECKTPAGLNIKFLLFIFENKSAYGISRNRVELRCK